MSPAERSLIGSSICLRGSGKTNLLIRGVEYGVETLTISVRKTNKIIVSDNTARVDFPRTGM